MPPAWRPRREAPGGTGAAGRPPAAPLKASGPRAAERLHDGCAADARALSPPGSIMASSTARRSSSSVGRSPQRWGDTGGPYVNNVAVRFPAGEPGIVLEHLALVRIRRVAGLHGLQVQRPEAFFVGSGRPCGVGNLEPPSQHLPDEPQGHQRLSHVRIRPPQLYARHGAPGTHQTGQELLTTLDIFSPWKGGGFSSESGSRDWASVEVGRRSTTTTCNAKTM